MLKEVAEKNRTARDTLKTLIETVPFGVVVADVNGNITGDAGGPSSKYQLLRANGTPLPPDELPLVKAIQRNETVKDLDVDGFLMKPIDKAKMAKTVRKALDEAKG